MLGGCLTQVPSSWGGGSQRGRVADIALGLQEEDLKRQKEWDHSAASFDMQLSLSRQTPAMVSFLPFGHKDWPEAPSLACFRPRSPFMWVFKGLCFARQVQVSSRSALPLVLGTWPLRGFILELENSAEDQILQRSCVCNR